jgi:uncharacterized protein DUF2867
MAFPVTKFRWRSRGAFIYTREEIVRAAPESVFGVVSGMGGQHGWLFANVLWRLRGAIDRALGGVGMRRRRDPDHLRVGDVVDFWRVENLHYPTFLRYAAEMKLPGQAWLQFQFNPVPDGTLLRSEAIFKTNGFLGVLYWYAMYPVHVFLFTGMLHAIAARAETQASPVPLV